MRPELIILVPAVLACWVAMTESLSAALIGVYLPVLLLIPDYFRLPIDGFPDPAFNQAVILPIGIAVLWKAVIRREWTVSWLDFWVFGYAIWQFVSDFHNVGYRDAQNLFFDVVTLSLLPYICAKSLIESQGVRSAFARRFVFLLFVVSVLSTYEFRMGESLFRPFFAAFFPGQEPTWFTQTRWGFGRVAGPYGHSILMGCILSTAYLLSRWLSRSGQWETNFRWLGKVPFTKQQILAGGLVIAMVMTLSRGPWLGAIFGLVMASVGTSVNYRRALKLAAVFFVVGSAVAYIGGKMYLESTREPEQRPGVTYYSETEEMQSVAYRAQLIDQYVQIALQRPVWGWGRANWPQVPGLSSVDNNYLFIALNTGLTGVAVFVVMLLVGLWRLFVSGFLDESLSPTERSFHFTLMGVMVAIVMSTTTVYLGSQLYPLLFLFLGWADGVVIQRSAQVSAMTRLQTRPVGFQMLRVIA